MEQIQLIDDSIKNNGNNVTIYTTSAQGSCKLSATFLIQKNFDAFKICWCERTFCDHYGPLWRIFILAGHEITYIDEHDGSHIGDANSRPSSSISTVREFADDTEQIFRNEVVQKAVTIKQQRGPSRIIAPAENALLSSGNRSKFSSLKNFKWILLSIWYFLVLWFWTAFRSGKAVHHSC